MVIFNWLKWIETMMYSLICRYMVKDIRSFKNLSLDDESVDEDAVKSAK
jgi:hypothetical protein